VNADDPNAEEFTKFGAEKIIRCGIKNQSADLVAKDIKIDQNCISYKLQASSFKLNLIGEFNIMNALLATAAANFFGVSLDECTKALENFKGSAGRMEEIENNRGFRVFVDYAPEPSGMKSALSALSKLAHNRIIHVFGSTGGHRDTAKRFEFGKISARYADSIIITNDDVYESDPEEIAISIDQGIKEGARSKGQEIHHEIILDRKQAISRALSIAQKGDIVIFTGKGSEQFLVLPGDKRIEWDEREVVREAINRL
jgi:UDP-N-acetylmuramoyl-L-alanyl-D-glutamate--2,6-diaminopimelate ligase